MTRFFDDELIDLIDEVGHYVEFAIREQITPGDTRRAIPPKYEFRSRRRIKAYLTTDDTSVPLPNGESRFGLIQAYVLGSAVAMSEFTGNSMIIYERKTYQIQYQQDIRSQGRLVLHKLMLVPAQDYKTVNQQDGVVRAAEPQHQIYTLPAGSPGAPPPVVVPDPPPVPAPFAPD